MEISYEQRQEEIMRMIKFGDFIKKLRLNKGVSLAEVSMHVGVSGNYIGEIERGVKAPSDELVRSFAKYYKQDEIKLYKILGRVPLLVKTEIENSSDLQETLIYISKHFTDIQKKDIYSKFKDIAEEMVKHPNNTLFELLDDYSTREDENNYQ